eukprot:9667549-Heterocapsa_arctica.AAC.1
MAPNKDESAAARLLREAASREDERKLLECNAKIAEQQLLLHQARAAADRDGPTPADTPPGSAKDPTPAESTPARKMKG